MPNKYPRMDAGMDSGVSQLAPSSGGRSGGKRKINLVDTLDRSGYKRLAPKPDAISKSTGHGHSLGSDGTSAIQEASLQPAFTSVGPIPTLDVSETGGDLPWSGVMSGSMQVSMNQEAQVMEHPVSGGEGLMNLNPPAPGTWRFPVSTDFASQASDFEYSGASGHFPGIQSQSPSRKLSGQGCPQNIGSSLVACPWRSHLEMIMSIDLDISLLQNETSTTMEPSLREGLRVLLGHLVELKRSYFILQDSVQPSKPGSLLR